MPRDCAGEARARPLGALQAGSRSCVVVSRSSREGIEADGRTTGAARTLAPALGSSRSTAGASRLPSPRSAPGGPRGCVGQLGPGLGSSEHEGEADGIPRAARRLPLGPEVDPSDADHRYLLARLRRPDASEVAALPSRRPRRRRCPHALAIWRARSLPHCGGAPFGQRPRAAAREAYRFPLGLRAL